MIDRQAPHVTPLISLLHRLDGSHKVRWQMVAATLGLVILASLVTFYVPILKEKSSLLPFVIAVILSAWIGGVITSLIATASSAISWSFFIATPVSEFSISAGDTFRLALFVLVAVLICSLYVSQNRTRRLIEASEKRLRFALNASKLAIWEFERENRSFWTSDGFGAIWSIADSSEPITFARMQGQVHPDDRPVFVETIIRSFETGDAFEITHRLVVGETIVRTSGHAEYDTSGRVMKIVGVVATVQN